MKNFINSHNHKLIKTKDSSLKNCNCINRNNYLFNGQCLSKRIYTAAVCCTKGNKEYVGSTGIFVKTRLNQLKYSFNNERVQQTMLSKFYKSNKNSISEIKWSKEYVPNKSDDCSKCNLKRMAIAILDREKSLNIRNDLGDSLQVYVFLNKKIYIK